MRGGGVSPKHQERSLTRVTSKLVGACHALCAVFSPVAVCVIRINPFLAKNIGTVTIYIIYHYHY